MKTKELSIEKHLMVKKMGASLRVRAQLGKTNQVVMVVLMEMGDCIKAENHPEKGKDHQMGLEK